MINFERHFSSPFNFLIIIQHSWAIAEQVYKIASVENPVAPILEHSGCVHDKVPYRVDNLDDRNLGLVFCQYDDSAAKTPWQDSSNRLI
jgi:hypothetical protein